MDYKEKYEALVGGIKGWLDKYVGDWQHGVFNLPFDKTGEIAKDIIKLVPELRESEDERIRKNILALVKKHAVNHERCQMEAYLEKQKEQIRAEIAPNQFDGITYGMQGRSTAMPAERTINKWAGSKRGLPPGTRTMFPVKGDDDNDLDLALDILQMTLGQVDGYQSDDGILEHKRAIMAVTDAMNAKPAEWTDADEKILKRIIDRQKFVIPIPGAGESPFLASFERREDTEAINWLKRRVTSQPQQEKEWSEEDEKNWRQIFACIKDDALKEWLEKQKAKIIADIKNDQTTEEKEYVRTIKSLVADAIRATEINEVKDEVHGEIIAQSGPNVAFYQRLIDWVEGRHIDQTIAWKKYGDGHRFDSDTVVIGLNRSEPRLVRCAVSACYGIAVKDLLKLPFCL